MWLAHASCREGSSVLSLEFLVERLLVGVVTAASALQNNAVVTLLLCLRLMGTRFQNAVGIAFATRWIMPAVTAVAAARQLRRQ